MRLVIFTYFKSLSVQSWLKNELDAFAKGDAKFLVFFVAKSKSQRFKKYDRFFTYLPRCKITVSELVYLSYCQARTFINHPVNYIRVLFFLLTHYNWHFVLNFLKLTKVIPSIDKFKPDFFYGHSNSNLYVLSFLASIFYEKKFGLILHSTPKYHSYVSHINQYVDFIIVKSKYLKKVFLMKSKGILDKKVVVLPWGINVNLFKKSKIKKSDNLFTIISVSRFVEMKGLIYLLKACKVLAEQNVKFKCILIGFGPLKRVYQQYIIKHNLRSFIKIHSFIHHSRKLQRFLSSADLSVLPSVIDIHGEVDIIPNALLEAMSIELPVITTHVGGMSEVIEDGVNGFFVKEKDEYDLARMIKEIKDMPVNKRRMIGIAARKLVIEKFDMVKQTDRLMNFLQLHI